MQCDAADPESIDADVKLPIFIRMMNPRREPMHSRIDAATQTHTQYTQPPVRVVQPTQQWRPFLLNSGGGDMASAEREPIMGAGGRAPSRVQGQRPWSEAQGGKAP